MTRRLYSIHHILFQLLRLTNGSTLEFHVCFIFQGAVLIKNLAAKEPSALGLDTYYKQYYLCLAAAAATIKWFFSELAKLLQAFIS